MFDGRIETVLDGMVEGELSWSIYLIPTEASKRVYDVVADELLAIGVDCLFGVLGEDVAFGQRPVQRGRRFSAKVEP